LICKKILSLFSEKLSLVAVKKPYKGTKKGAVIAAAAAKT